jgi:hypothetical protein
VDKNNDPQIKKILKNNSEFRINKIIFNFIFVFDYEADFAHEADFDSFIFLLSCSETAFAGHRSMHIPQMPQTFGSIIAIVEIASLPVVFFIKSTAPIGHESIHVRHPTHLF